MRIRKDRPLQNIEDRRFENRGRRRRGGTPVKLGLGGILILGILSIVFDQNFFSLLDATAPTSPSSPGAGIDSPSAARTTSAEEEDLVLFLNAVLAENQELWQRSLPQLGAQYRNSTLVFYRDVTRTGCGYGQGATGPFYCPGDEKVYIDLSFFDQLAGRFGAPGDFAQAYVLAHEVAHHVQNVLGIEAQMRRLQRQNPRRANDLSVRMELQADCLAGVWGHTAAQKGQLESGDVEEGLRAAAAVGDDRLQKAATGMVQPETFTHGTSRQRMEWFQRGFRSGDPDVCDTFGASRL
ncbi:MAG: zinc metallopeptidase [Thermoanaerobaculia bacterium]|nr:zinc metallopeptidase [Thermoanaerobaculia bacterium]